MRIALLENASRITILVEIHVGTVMGVRIQNVVVILSCKTQSPGSRCVVADPKSRRWVFIAVTMVLPRILCKRHSSVE